MKRVVFISHSSADKPVAERACTYLEKNGVSCWMAPRDVTPGKNYGAAIIDAIDECQVFVLILSSHSNTSRQVVREVERAASTDSVILPFRIEDVQPSRDIAFYVSAAHWLDAAQHPVDEQFDELLTAIKNWQTTEASGEQVSLPSPQPQVSVSLPSAPVPPKTPGAFQWWWLLIGVAGVIAAAGTWIAVQLMNPGRLAHPAPVAQSSSPVATPEATPTVPEPTPTATSPTPIETPTPTPVVVMTAAPNRLKPGERHRPATTPEVAAAPSPATSPPAPPQVPKGPIVREVAASSQFDSEFRPNLAFDGNPATEWVPKGRAIGQSLFVNFKAPAVIRSVSILNGDGRDEEHYQESNRVRSLRIILSDGTNQLLNFKDEMKMQRFELQKPVTASWAKFEIVSVYPGTKIKRAGISEIAFNEPEE